MEELASVAKRVIHDSKRWVFDRRVRIGIGLAILLGVPLMLLIVHRYSPKSVGVNCAFKISDQKVLPETSGDAFKVDTCVRLEVASTESQRVLGLSGRTSMPQDSGLLFDFGTPGEYCMWMKDMHFALDMLWLNGSKQIVHIRENITPDTYPQSFCGPSDAQYVIEVNKDVVKAADLRLGQKLRF